MPPFPGVPGDLQIRPARPSDLPALLAMVERCTLDSLVRRFHSGIGPPVVDALERIAHTTPEHRSWVATDGDAVRGTSTLARGCDGVSEAAFLVEDGWMRRGVARALFRPLAREARRAGTGAVTAWVQADNLRAIQFLRAMAPGARVRLIGGELEVTVPVAAGAQVPGDAGTPAAPLGERAA